MNQLPAIDPDSPQNHDADPFGRLPFARQLADYLVLPNGQDSLVLGLEGEWGSGKSWVIERVKRLLAERKRPDGEDAVVVINFNPWLIGSETELIAAFMQEMAAQLVEHGSRSVRIKDKAGSLARAVAAYGDKLTYLKYLKYVPGIAPVGEFFEDHADQIKQAADKAKKALEPVKPSLASSRHAIETALSQLNLPVVVVIDDLDRLRKHEIQTMIQVVKAVGNFKGVAYLLSYDSRYVAQAISHDGTLASGFAYLEKIVQLACHLPPLVPWIYRDWLAASVNQLLQQRGKTLNAFESAQFDDNIKLVARLLRHPRDAYRWFNRLRWVFGALADALDFGDLMVVEALQIVSPESIRALVARPALVFRQYDKHFFPEDGSNLVEPDLSDWVAQVSSELDVQRALLTLFPHLAHPALQIMPDSMARGHQRLQVYEHWTRYLNLSSVPGQRDAQYAHRLLANAHEYGKLENRFDGSAEFGEFCHSVVDYLTPALVADPGYFLASFCKAAAWCWDSGVSMETLNIASHCLKTLLQALPEPSQTAAVENMLGTLPLSLSGMALGRWNDQARAGWLHQLDQDSKLEFATRDHALAVLQTLQALRGIRAARAMIRRLIQARQLLALVRYFDAPTRDLALFALLPNTSRLVPILTQYADGGHISRQILQCIANPETAAEICTLRQQVAQTLLQERKQRKTRSR